MTNPWFKFYGTEYLGDRKIRKLTGDERSCWITLLALASSESKDGVIKNLNENDLLEMSGVSQKISVLEKLQELDMILVSNGIVTVTNWEKRQYSESLNRVREFRKRQGNDDVTTEEIREEENREDKKREDKNIYGDEFKKVRLTSEEYLKLTEKLGEKNTLILIGDLDRYIASNVKGKKYLSHYAVILTWAKSRIEKNVESNKPKRTIA